MRVLCVPSQVYTPWSRAHAARAWPALWRLASAARAAGVRSVTLVVEEWGFHEMPCFALVIPEAMAATARIATFCRRALAYRAGTDAAASAGGGAGGGPGGILNQISPQAGHRTLEGNRW